MYIHVHVHVYNPIEACYFVDLYNVRVKLWNAHEINVLSFLVFLLQVFLNDKGQKSLGELGMLTVGRNLFNLQDKDGAQPVPIQVK